MKLFIHRWWKIGFFRAASALAAAACIFAALVFAQSPVSTSPSPISSSPEPVSSSPTPVSATPVLSPTVGLATTVKMEAESVEITDFAAYPPTLTRPSGPFILHLVNKTGATPPSLQWAIAPGATGQLSTLASAINLAGFSSVPRLFSVLNLASGKYVLGTSSGKVFLTLTIQ